MSTPLERFAAKVNKAGPMPVNRPDLGPCWLWTASTNQKGYGRFRAGRMVKAHRWSYEHFVGPIPDGLMLDHLCRVPRCVRPAHLEPVTNRVNQLRGVSPSAQHAAVTACPRGHTYDEANTYRHPNGSRQCRACGRDAVRRYKAKKRALAARRTTET